MACDNSATALTCCSERNFVQDKVCTPWTGTVTGAEVDIVAYTNNINPNLVGTGYVKFDSGPTAITLDVLNSAGASILTATVPISPGTSLAFTYQRFATIQLTLAGGSPGLYQGEFCITTRYSIQ
ncbi:hypothetical protein PAECIP111891_02707 [Paenibacillus allorhizoplanae]|uniref:Endospore appendages core domain-containing protein n=1 Tax=Paenibacillus allorhizoplanae TaxID=2905648 RepID=A0ABN8GGI3_9BACL|nr:S-Ena type endospore appendage [Paenibacillus allorhizoplanae]CAH1205207.1 hypothetical protein PAECIP111891_02707 [Paenibacillus allorhizoplanae]